ncbi:hypothetical protein BGX29_001209 [Mortierella sp. GBA35]|nr:hypothetical protein BGX29_001209 [Mortierella sp. GBA35]
MSRAWSSDFVPIIWHTIDLSKQISVLDLGMSVILSHGRHIRHIKGLDLRDVDQTNKDKDDDSQGDGDSGDEVMASTLALCGSFTKHLRSLSIKFGTNPLRNLYGWDLVRRNRGSLTDLKIFVLPGLASYTNIPAHHFIPTDIVAHPTSSKLGTIGLYYVCLSREAFSMILQLCPRLTSVHVYHSNIVYEQGSAEHGLDESLVKHSAVWELVATIKDVLNPDRNQPSPSLLRHFPGLLKWAIADTGRRLSVLPAVIKEEIASHCPRLHIFGIESGPPPVVASLLSDGLPKISFVVLQYASITSDVVLALLYHRKTINRISAYIEATDNYETDDVLGIPDPLAERGRTLQHFLHMPHLHSFVFKEHIMDITWFENNPWKSNCLWNLAVRFKDLDTKEKVDRTFELFSSCRDKAKTTRIAGRRSLSSRQSKDFATPVDIGQDQGQVGQGKSHQVESHQVESEQVDVAQDGDAANQQDGAGAMVIQGNNTNAMATSDQDDGPSIDESDSDCDMSPWIHPFDFLEDDETIETRVAQLLLQQTRLTTIWLGTTTRHFSL